MTEEEEILQKENLKRKLRLAEMTQEEIQEFERKLTIMATENTPETPEDAPKTSSATMPQSR